MSISALRKLLSSSSSSSSSSHASISTLAPHSSTRRDRVALFDRAATFLSTGTSSTTTVQNTHHDIATLLRSYLTQSKHAPILASLRDQLSSPILNSIAEAVQRAPNCAKRQLSSLVTPHYHRNTLQAMCFPISAPAYTTAQRHARAVGAGAHRPPPPLPPSKQPPSPATMQSLATFLDAHSQPAACRTAKVNKTVVPARILTLQHAELHRLWKAANPSTLCSPTAFSRAVRSLRVYKPISKRMTDVCDHCVEGRRHEALLEKQLQQQHQPECPFITSVQHLLDAYCSTTSAPPPMPDVNQLPACTCLGVSALNVDATRGERSAVVCSDVHVSPVDVIQSAEEQMEIEATTAAADGRPAALYSRIEGRVKCKRPSRRRPSIEVNHYIV